MTPLTHPKPGPAPGSGAPPLGRFVAIASGKGGVGKTWFAITLSHALARRGRRILLVDADFGLANIDVQLGCNPLRDLGDVIGGRCSVADAILRYGPGQFDLLAGRSGSGLLATLEAEKLEALLEQISVAGQHYDTVIVDLGAGLDRAVRRFSAWSETLLAVATDEPTSLTDAYAALKLTFADGGGHDARLVINQAATSASAERTAATLSRACQSFLGRAPAVAGFIRRDPRIGETIRHQSLLLTRYPNSPASQDIDTLADSLHFPHRTLNAIPAPHIAGAQAP